MTAPSSPQFNGTSELWLLSELADALGEEWFDPLNESWETWLPSVFPEHFSSFGSHHAQLWDWVWRLRPGHRPDPFVAIWPRKHGKSTSAEVAAVVVGARQVRRYVLYISESQAQADDHVDNIATILESPQIAARYPGLGIRAKGKFGNSLGWRRSRVRTAAGLNIDAYGLDSAVRGVRLGTYRPDMIICDDIDDAEDTVKEVTRKRDRLTKAIFPTGSQDVAILMIQNMVSSRGIFKELSTSPADGGATYLNTRTISGPIPAIEGLEVEHIQGRTHIVAGTPTWDGYDLRTAQQEINDYNYDSFLSEFQHRVLNPDDIVIKRDYFRVAPAPPNAKWVRGVDLALGTKQQSDYTASIKFTIHADQIYLAAPLRWKRAWPDSRRLLKSAFLPEGDVETVAIESNAFQAAAVQEFQADPELRRLNFVGVNSAKDKLIRASGWIAKARDHGIVLCSGYTWDDWLAELEEFPNGSHDDTVDAISVAYQRWLDSPPIELLAPISLTGASRWNV